MIHDGCLSKHSTIVQCMTKRVQSCLRDEEAETYLRAYGEEKKKRKEDIQRKDKELRKRRGTTGRASKEKHRNA